MGTSSVNDAILALRRRYAASLPAKAAVAAESVGALLAASEDSAVCETAHRILHRLVGSAGTYGFPDLSRIARSAEILLQESLDTGVPLSPEGRLDLVNLTARLGSLAASAAREAASGAA